MWDIFKESLKQARLESSFAVHVDYSKFDPRVVALFELGLTPAQVGEVVSRWGKGEQVDLSKYTPLNKA